MNQFQALGLGDSTMRAISDLGFIEPTPIQEQAIPLLVDGLLDFVGLAQTGTGKTAAFGLPLVELINPMSSDTQAIILAPTRELCNQIHRDLESYSKYENLNIVAVYGGADARNQMRQIKKGAQIICATPGRLIDFIKRGVVDLNSVERVILDEADEMLNMGFYDDIQYILANTPNRESAWLFSATMPAAIRKLSKKFMNDPIEVSISAINSTNENIEHKYYLTSASKRIVTLKRILDFHPDMFGIVFTRTKKDAKMIADRLLQEGYKSDALHGDLSQDQRDIVMNRFRERSLQILVATDVAARGIDVSDITHVINFELPDDYEVYTHRSGRTGRAGKNGQSVSIIQSRDLSKIRRIEKMCKSKFERGEIPTGEDILQNKLKHAAQKILDQDTTAVDGFDLGVLHEQLSALDKEELISRIAALQISDDILRYQNAQDLNSDGFGDEKRSGERTSIFINVGTKDGFNEGRFRQWIEDSTDISKDLIYRVHLKDIIAFFDIESSVADQIIKTLHGQKYNNRKLRLDKSDKQPTHKKRHKAGGKRPTYKPSYKGQKAFKPKRKKAKY